MKGSNIRSLVTILLIATYAAAGVPVAEASVSASGFNVVSAVWGTAAVPIEGGPGLQNVPLTVTLQYYFQNTAEGISVTLSLPPGFTDTNGNPSATAYVSGQVPSGAVLPLTFSLNIGSKVAIGNYSFPMTISWGAITQPYPIQSVSVTQSTSVSVYLKGKVLLQFSPGQATLTAGALNHLPILVNNTGTGNATNVELSITAAGSVLSSASLTVLGSPPQIDVIPAHSSVVTYVDVFVPQVLAGTSATISVAGTYSDAYGNTRPLNTAVGVYVSSISSSPITVWALSLALTPGAVNNSTIVISNTSQQALTQLQVSITAPPTVSVLRQLPIAIPNLQPGETYHVSLPLFVSAALSGTPVTLPVVVTYTDAAGETDFTTQSLGFYAPSSANPRIQLAGYTYTPAVLYPGNTVATLQISVLNSGTTSALGVNATLIPSGPVYAITTGSFSKSYGMLPVGQTLPFVFLLGIRNSSSPINTTLSLQVSMSGVPPVSLNIPFTENPKATLQVESVSTPSIVAGDSADYITVVLRNSGTVASQYTTITMFPSNVFQPSVPSSESPLLALTAVNASVGTILPDQKASFTYVLQVSSNVQPGTYPVTFFATWRQPGSTQAFAQQLNIQLSVAPTVYQVASGYLSNPLVLLLIVLLVVALVVVVVRRRRAGSR